jgi:hypothetical protein
MEIKTGKWCSGVGVHKILEYITKNYKNKRMGNMFFLDVFREVIYYITVS